MANTVKSNTDIVAQSTANDAYWYGTTAYNQINNGGVNVIRSIQRGKCNSIDDRNGITINTINPSKSFVIIEGGAGIYNNGTADYYVAELSSNRLKILPTTYWLDANGSGGGNFPSSPVFSWQVIEYI